MAAKDRRKLYAVVCLLLMIATWVAMAELLQGMEHSTYNKPLFQTYLIHSTYVILLLPWLFTREYPDSWKKFFSVNFVFCTISFVSAALWYVSLSRTTVPANTVIYQSTSVMVYIFSLFMLSGERISPTKIFSVLVSIGGVSLVTFTQKSSSSTSAVQSTALGYISVIASMVLYALYETLYKKIGNAGLPKIDHHIAHSHSDPLDIYARDDNKTSSPLATQINQCCLFIGVLGAMTFLTMWPLLLIGHYSGLEPFEMPPSWTELIVNSLLDGVFQTTLILGIAFTTPLFIAVGTMLMIPVTVIVDWIVHGTVLSLGCWFGSALVVGGFFLQEYGTKLDRSLCPSKWTDDADPMEKVALINATTDEESITDLHSAPKGTATSQI